ncbi:MAG: hypothetical protein ACRBN8_18530 [Nannocystales bacterium]
MATLPMIGGCDEEKQDSPICPDDGSCEDPSVDDDPRGCGEQTITVLTDLSVVPAGFERSAADILGSIEASYAGELTWRPNDGPISVAHAETSSALSLTVTHDGGEVRLVEVELAGQYPNGQEGGAPCSNHLEIDTAISFSTEDGLFAETWDATVRKIAAEHEFSEDGTPSLYRSIDFAAHEGTLATSDFAFEGAQLQDVIVTAGFGEDEVTGSLLMEVRSGDDETGWIGAGDVASFSATPLAE